MAVFASLLLLTAAAGVGWGPAVRWLTAGRSAGGLAWTCVIAGLGGLLALYAWLWLGGLLGLPWRRATILGFLVPGLATSFVLARARRPDFGRPRPSAMVGGLLALGAVLAFALASARLWNLHPDFVYHWGIKGAHFHLAGGIDFEYLSRPWNGHLHPDYPNLLPALFAASSELAGAFDPAALALGSVFFLVLLLLALWELLARCRASPFAAAVGVALVAWGVALFGIGFRQAGGADLPMALAVAACAVALVGQGHRHADAQVAVAATFAACCKIEGVPLAAFVLVAHALRHGGGAVGVAKRLLRAGWPAAVVTTLWLGQCLHHELLLDTNTGRPDLARLAIVLPQLARSLAIAEWQGLTVSLLVLPWLLRWRAGRWIAAVLCAQAAFYLYTYLSAPVDTQLLVATSAPRLALHLVPTALALLAARFDPWRSGRSDLLHPLDLGRPLEPSHRG